MKRNKLKELFPIAGTFLVVAAGMILINTTMQKLPAYAQLSSPTTQTTQQKNDAETADDVAMQGNQSEQAPSYKSSITTTDTNEQDEKTEQSKLASLAKITADQAKVAAEKSLGATASEVKLENDGGNVVYAVTVGTKEAKVDAGNGAILHTETSDGEVNDGGQ